MITILKILLGLLILLVSSCSYRMSTITDTNGNEYRVRDYKKHEDQVIFDEKSVFENHYQTKTYLRYTDSISLITVDGFPYLQFDNARIGFGPSARNHIEIFSNGLLNGKLIYCTKDSLCRPPAPAQRIEIETGNVIKPHISDWYGNIINIGLIEEPEHLKISPQKRRFKLWINAAYGTHGYDVYFIELVNEKVDKYVDIKEFVKEASLTFIYSPWSII